MCGLMSPLEAIQRGRAWVTASTSVVKLEVETRIDCSDFMDGSRSLLDSEARPP